MLAKKIPAAEKQKRACFYPGPFKTLHPYVCFGSLAIIAKNG
jgi:hypothetical protein